MGARKRSFGKEAKENKGKIAPMAALNAMDCLLQVGAREMSIVQAHGAWTTLSSAFIVHL